MSQEPHTGRPITADDLFALHLVGDPQPSPDGSWVAYVVTRLDKDADDYKAAIWIVPIEGGAPRQLTSGSARDTTPRWSPDGREITFVSNRPPHDPPLPPTTDEPDPGDVLQRRRREEKADAKPKNQIWVLPVGGGEARQLTRQRHGASAPSWAPDGRTVAFLSPTEPQDDPERRWSEKPPAPVADERIIDRLRFRADGRGFFAGRYAHLWAVPATGGEARQLTGGDQDDGEMAWSPDGARIVFVANRTPDRDRNLVSALYVVPVAGGDVRPLVERDARFSAPAWSPDGSRLAFLGHDRAELGGKNAALWIVPAAGGEPSNHTTDWDRSFGDFGMSDAVVGADQRPVWGADGRVAFALASDQGTTHVQRVSLDDRAVTPVTTGPRRVTEFRTTPDGGRLVFAAGTASRPNEIFVAGIDGADERQLTDHNRTFVDEVAWSEAEEIRFPSQSGDREIQGWLLKPPGHRPDGEVKYPLIVQIHGGPHAMYGHSLFHEMQLMAARGYVVLYTNPRGSAGYGEEFTTCTRAKWGEADAPDVLGALDAVLGRGDVDPARVGVTGGSYGGYLTNWLIGHSDRFRAAVTQRCVSNFLSMYGTSDIGFDFGEHEFGGTPWDQTELLWRHSPLASVARMETPLLILHSEADLRCPIEQAEQLYVALKRLGREVRFVRMPDEDHNLSRSGTPSRRLARLHHLIGWFDAHL